MSWWRGEDTATDVVGSNHGTATNGATFGPGLVGRAFQFDGVDDVIVVPDSASLRLSTSSPRTLEAWAFRTSAAWPLHLAGRRAGCGGGIDFYQLAIGINAIPPDAVPLNAWAHLAVTYDGVIERHYVNAVVVLERAVAYAPGPVTAPLLIGSSGTCAPFAGRIDELTLYSRALTVAELAEIVAAGGEGKAGSLASPTGLTAVVTLSTVQLAWNAAPGATSYRLLAGFTPGASDAFNGNIGNTTTITAAAPAGTYFVRVQAEGPGGPSGPSNEVRLDVVGACALPPPPAPVSLTATVQGSAVALGWGAAAGATSYVVEVGSSTGAANLLSVATGNALTSFGGTAPPGVYFVRVRGRNACGTGPASNEVLVLVGSV